MTEWREYRELEEIERGEHSVERAVQILAGQFKDFGAKLDRLIEALVPPDVAVKSFQIIQLGENMATPVTKITGIAPGSTGTFSAIPLDANGNQDALPKGVVPVWTSSDTTNAPVVASADGLSATVTVPATAPGGTAFALTVSATLPDGTVPTSGPTDVPFLALAVKSFVINQTS